jgi:uncharacterized protein HemX
MTLPVAAASIPSTGNPYVDVVLGVIAALVVAYGGAQIGRRQTLAEIRKADAQSELAEAQTGESEANAAKTITEIAMSLMEPLQRRLDELSQQNQSQAERLTRQATQLEQNHQATIRCHTRVDTLQSHIDELERRLLAAGIDPPPRPIIDHPNQGGATP